MLVTADEIYEAIAARFAPPEWACFSEVANTTGFAAHRRADAVAFNLWPSRGLEIRGFEIKVSRSDLMHELKKVPEKAETLAQFCDTWWLVCPKDVIAGIDMDIIPLAWGVLVYHPNTKKKLLRMTKEAAKNEEPTPADRPFLASVLRHADEHVKTVTGQYIHRDAIADKLEAEYERGLKYAPRDQDNKIRELEAEVEANDVIVKALGIDLGDEGWRKLNAARDVADALKVGRALARKYGHDYRDIGDLGDELIEVGKKLKAVKGKLDGELTTAVQP